MSAANNDSSDFAERYYNFLQNAQNEKYDKVHEIDSDQLSLQEREFICAILKQSIDELVLINIKSLEIPGDMDRQAADHNLDQMIAIKFEEDV